DDNFGISVALSNSGDTAVVGAYKADIGENTDQGALYVFKRADGVWENHYKLVADDGAANDKLGWSVAISGDGNTILTGAHAADVDGKIDQGAGYVFHYVYLLGWVDEKLTFNSPKEDISLGYSVALSDDGDTALLGAPTWPSPDGTDGMVTSFTRSGANTWTSEDFFWPSNAEPDQWFGRSVALSADGNTAIVGASKDDVGDNVDQGSAYILTHSSGFWSQVVNLTASDGLTGDEFGVSVAISGDGNTALVGAYLADVSGDADQGRAYLFNCPSGGAWQKVIGWTSNEAGDNFGVSVALSDDGATALVGARSDDVGDNVDQGAAYLYRADNGVWGPYGFITLTASDGTANDKFGFSVALSEDGSTALVGAYNASLGGISQGAAYPFGQQSDFTLYIPFVAR
ncbi:MAG: hypothetical protein JW726_00965, partial [Anaerolineales bacterium]|nr:hypothetical protein [Anaerolineales bacterium]